MRFTTTVSIPLRLPLDDPRIDGLLNLVEEWAANNDVETPVTAVSRTPGSDVLEDTRARVRHFLEHAYDEPDAGPMWVIGGVILTWGDLRVLCGHADGRRDGTPGS